MPLTHSDDLIRATARDSFWNAYDGPPSVFEGLVATYDSNSDQETYAALGSPPSVREMMGSKMRKALAPLKYTVVNKKYEGSFIVDYPTRKFGRLGAVMERAAEAGMKARNHVDKLISENFLVFASGVIPQISVILGPCAGGAVYSPALMDFVIQTRDTSFMFLTGPDVIKAITGEDVTAQTLGGAEVHGGRSGVCHLAAASEPAALELVKRLLGYLPQNNHEDPQQLAP